ncbi:MAG: NADH-quinone oxidoreductase subunit [Thermomicrobiales bacterium]|jgi:NADH-quinone oxidoreductase subunit L|nr:NADH-quinone oxidoreductase subunit [Thermomicrobiales bacterium]
MADYLFLIPLLPLAAFAINFLFGRRYIRNNAHWIAAPAVFGSWLLSLLVLLDVRDKDHAISQHLFTWIPSGDFNIDVNLYVDQLTAVMLMVVTTVGFLVHVFSVGYITDQRYHPHGDEVAPKDPRYFLFFAYLPLFVFSMLMLVLADNYLLMFVFWEAVGLCSYLLIGFYFWRRSAVNAAKKAFIVNRVGDLGFGLGIMWTFAAMGTLSFYGDHGVFAQASSGAIATGTLTGIALLLFTGACGKSAQFPLHVWLPDAMEGPTPVSALIHAATMVTAGIYMVARSHSIFLDSGVALWTVATIGAFTAFMAATIALTQDDIKRVVAYSTLSQLGYMAAGLGTGVFTSSIFHLMTHAFFKGLLFLGCGAVIYAMLHEQNIWKMGGLRRFLPITYWTFLIAAAANSGVFPLAGFWSKDELIVGAWTSPTLPSWGKVIAIVLLASAVLTALYMFRLVFIVFHGKPRFDAAHFRPKEPPAIMTVPLILLAIPSAVVGFLGFPPDDGPLHHFLSPVFASHDASEPAHGTETASLYTLQDEEHPAESEEGAAHAHVISNTTKVTFGILSTVGALLGIFIAYLAYIKGTINPAALSARYSGLYLFLKEKWRWDELYDRVFVRPSKAAAMFFWRVVDVEIIDGTVNGIAVGIGAISQRLRHVQTGLVANYALAIALGMVVMVGVYLAAFSNLFR